MKQDMKKVLILIALLIISIPALAQHWSHGHRHHGHARYYGHNNWVVPIIIGGVVGAAIANRPAQAETVIVQQQPIYMPQESCTPWKEIQTTDGRTYRERTCTQ
jgi:hypothetical protein